MIKIIYEITTTGAYIMRTTVNANLIITDAKDTPVQAFHELADMLEDFENINIYQQNFSIEKDKLQSS